MDKKEIISLVPGALLFVGSFIFFYSRLSFLTTDCYGYSARIMTAYAAAVLLVAVVAGIKYLIADRIFKLRQ